MKTLCKDLLLLSDEDIWLDIGWEGGRKKYIGKVPWANFPSRIVPEKCSREKTTREKLPKTWAPTKSPPEKIPLDNYFWILELMLHFNQNCRCRPIFRTLDFPNSSISRTFFLLPLICPLLFGSLNCSFQSYHTNYSNFRNHIEVKFWKIRSFYSLLDFKTLISTVALKHTSICLKVLCD